MAYRNLIVGDKVRIVGGGEFHGCEGDVIESTGTGAKVAYFDRQGLHSMERWFNGRELIICRDAPIYEPQTQTTQEEIQMQQFKIGDKVKVISTGRGFENGSAGKVGFIRAMDETRLPVLVVFDDDDEDSDWGKFEEIELYIEQPVVTTTTVQQKLQAIAKLVAEVKELLG